MTQPEPTHQPHRLLITGGAGFIGANFVHYWLRHYPQSRVVVLDALTYAGNAASLAAVADHPNFRLVVASINDREAVARLLREEAIDTIVHFAAESHVDRSISGPDAFIETNIVGTQQLLSAALAVWQEAPGALAGRRFHHISTDEVYGSLGLDDPPFSEQTPYAPNSPYAASKAASDHLVRAWHHTYGLDTTTSNCSNNYGPYQFPEKLIPLLILNMLEGKTLPIYGDGSNIRDWLHVDDHCRGIDRILRYGVSGESYNIGGNCERTNMEVVASLCDEMMRHAPPAAGHYRDLIRFVSDRPGHDRRYAIDARRLEQELGFVPQVQFDQGIADTVRWYLTEREWWQGVRDGSYRDWMAHNYDQRQAVAIP